MDPLKSMYVTSPFGPRKKHPVTGLPAFHSGVDLRAHYEPAKAIAKGKVREARTMGGLGNTVVIDHDTYLTVYGHLSQYKVKVGDVVQAGQTVAITGNTGRTTGPHLHFEVRTSNLNVLWSKDPSNGQYRGSIDPIPFLAVDHWGKKHYNSINSMGLVIHEERYDDNITRAELFAIIDRLMKLGGKNE